MRKLRKLVQNHWVLYTLLAILLAVILPLISAVLHISAANRVLWLFLVIDSIYAIWNGYHIAKHHFSRWSLFIFPVIFLGFALIRYNPYVYYLAGLYLCLSYLTCSLVWPKQVKITK
ncbi:hypothetical protein FC83_GL002287 [Agrilactobacillus composti DSM 18527 = JCM 14202]|uniref:Integral membrane protein n=1 Tax=Agrilactobacillus composti DSM 18527 = JCM 14202 TaxID=1423734 RepID=X0PV89_9LACO|nr:hypothetical protein FC83_GL002287 [Agrilactobacillus composti DSM 18527 = JCM 14202]GAF41386.1 hypothetical protein JCM14202_3320 [Agrilactobacillus composti DSM 18527 = JCM 14202]